MRRYWDICATIASSPLGKLTGQKHLQPSAKFSMRCGSSMTNLNERCPNSTRSRLRKRGENQQLPTETTFAKQPSVPPTRRSEPASITTPPAPHKPDVAPAKTGIVIGDSMAECLAYGLEQAYAESADIGVVRKVRQSTGLIDQCKGELRKWVEQSLANEKPVFVAIMIGMSDRHAMQACAAPGKNDGANAGPYAFRSKEWAEAVPHPLGVIV